MNDASNWRRVGAEFIKTELELAFTFLDLARTSKGAETRRRNQENSRKAYDTVLRFFARCAPSLSAAELQAMENKLGELKKRVEQVGEGFSEPA